MAQKNFCLVDQNFENDASGRGVLVAIFRERGQKPLEVGGFMLDLGCTGVKDAFYTQIERGELEAFKKDIFAPGYREESPAWGRKLIEDSLAYAKSLGFKPHRDYKKAARVLGGIRTADCDTVFHFGREGKPFYFQGNHSDETARRIVDHLNKRLGEDGFHFMVEAPTALSETLDERINYFLDEAEAGRLKKARAGVEELAAANPEAALVHFARGVIHVYDEAHEAALQSFDRAIELDPEMDEAWMNKAAAHRVLGDCVEMIRAYQKVVALTPPHDELHERADDNLKRIADGLQRNEGMSIEAYVEAETLFSQAFEHYEKEEFEEAIRTIKDNPEQMPPNERTLTLLGNCYRRLKEWDLARDALERALEINPSHPTAQLAMTVLDAEERGMDFSSMVSDTLKKLQPEESQEA